LPRTGESGLRKSAKETSQRQCLRLTVYGAVQGVGFRPFVYRLAVELGLAGWINNTPRGVLIEIEGERQALDEFLVRLPKEKPAVSSIHRIETAISDAVGKYRGFEIRQSADDSRKTALILPDLATCHECHREIFDPNNRRYLYPFTNCTNCGPRFSIIEALPYDRPNTTMKSFIMCDECRAEYEDPSNRRFHAQPNACPKCGPHLELWDKQGRMPETRHDALIKTMEAVRAGKIAAIKGLGGFHLVVDAENEEGVRRLRERKGREEKPLALMFPDLDSIRSCCDVSKLESNLLTSPACPIVLLHRKSPVSPSGFNIAQSVAPDNPYLGIMLPYTPLHHILMAELNTPVIATSGNLSDEPICIDETEAINRLGDIADLFLVHNRPIARHVDDSIVRVMAGRELVLRRARGYAPLPVTARKKPPPLLAVGAHLKNTVAFSTGNTVFISQHIGDLDNKQAYNAFREVIGQFRRIYDQPPVAVACDMHPDYLSTGFARENGGRVIPVQHHLAHILSCMAENNLEGPVLGVSWDGTGYGPDRTIWGGEFLKVHERSYHRIAAMRHFALPGGDKAVREPRRTAFGLLYEIFGEGLAEMDKLAPVRSFSTDERQVLIKMLKGNINSPLTSSAGRLFDAAASLIGRRQVISFEGQAAMELEFLPDGISTDEAYTFPYPENNAADSKETVRLDWSDMFCAMIDDLRLGVSTGIISAKFHNALVEAIVMVARTANETNVVLSGGCFQNKYLTERAVLRLNQEGFRPFRHHLVPPNDGGISPGQVAAASYILDGE
jgi:hydrogenase maturation protein HypF